MYFKPNNLTPGNAAAGSSNTFQYTVHLPDEINKIVNNINLILVNRVHLVSSIHKIYKIFSTVIQKKKNI